MDMNLRQTLYLWFLCFCCIFVTAHEVSAEAGIADINQYESTTSPSRRFVALAGIGLADVSPSVRMRLRLLVLDLPTTQVQQVLPWVRGPWVVIWGPNDVLLVCGTSEESIEGHESYEISAHQFVPFAKVVHRKATEAEIALVRAAFHRKFGREPIPVSETVRPYDAFQPRQ